MTHPHKALLGEFKYALDHLVPTVPAEVVEEGRRMHQELADNPEASEDQIHDALVKIGKAEFAYRNAYNDMVGKASEAKRVDLVLDHLEPAVKEKVKHLLDSGVALDELVKSGMFETDFTAEERYQVEDGILHAIDHIKEELPKEIEARKAEYDTLVAEWKAKQAKMEEKIEELRALSNKDAKWKDEILDKVKTLEEGWAVTERDPDLLTIEKEIEYWQGTMEGVE